VGSNPTLSATPFFLALKKCGVCHGVCFELFSCRAAEQGLADMSERGNGYGSENRINIPKRSTTSTLAVCSGHNKT
jgi:hypothetical protein